MQHRAIDTVTEESVLFLSIFKWVFLASIIGAIVGTATSGFLYVLDLALDCVQGYAYYYCVLPIVLVGVVWVTKRLAPDSEGHGTERVIHAVHKRQSDIRLRVVPVKLITTIATLTFGGSVGKEGPCAQIGAALASGFAKLFRCSLKDRKKMVICGISAGFAAVFGTPLAGAIFGVEVLFMGNILYSVLLPSLIAGIVSFQIAQAWGIEYSYHIIALTDGFDLSFFLYTVLAGIFFGLICVLFIEFLRLLEKRVPRFPISAWLRAFLGGSLLVVGALLFSTDYLGLGLSVIDGALAGESVVWYAFLIKIMMTALTLVVGGSGGVLTPLFFVGATAGVAYASLFSLNTVVFAAIGMISVLAGAANTPIAACVLAIELFGSGIAPYATIACVVSFFMTGYRSIFPSQILLGKKTQSILVKKGEVVDTFTTHYNYRTRKQLLSARQLFKRLKKWLVKFGFFR